MLWEMRSCLHDGGALIYNQAMQPQIGWLSEGLSQSKRKKFSSKEKYSSIKRKLCIVYK